MPRRIVLDTDPGIDDSLAILLALSSPEVELAAVSVNIGNCSCEQGVRNARSVLALAQRLDIPVCPGAALPLLRPPFTAPETHGDAGLGYARLPDPPQPASDEHAVDMIIREIMSQPGEVTLVAVAPLTNVAMAVRKEPRIAQQVHELIIMGGALRADGNTTSLAEFNWFCDPHAAHIVLHSGFPITLVPWDVTQHVLFTEDDLKEVLRIASPVTNFVKEATRFYMDFHLATFGYSGCSINDPAAMALSFLPELAVTEPMHVDVEYTSELTIGKSVIGYVGDLNQPPAEHDQLGFDSSRWPMAWGQMTRHAPNVRTVTSFDNRRFIDMFVERIKHLAASLQA